MIELQKIFETNEVSSLRSLMFDFNNDPTTITPSADSTDETNLKLDE